MRKLVDIPNPTDREMFQFAELLKAARDVSLDRYLKIRDDMSERFQRQRVVVVTTAQLARTVRQRRKMIAAVEILANTYPDEPQYSLMLLDYYFPSRKYEEAMQALQRLSKRLGVDDAAMDARFSATALVLGNTADAFAYAEKATEREPGLELGWWSSLQVRAAMSDFAAATEVLKTLQDDFGYDLSPEFLQRDRSYAQLLASSDYKQWRESIK
jgi:predicted Zn-dependent protease